MIASEPSAGSRSIRSFRAAGQWDNDRLLLGPAGGSDVARPTATHQTNVGKQVVTSPKV